MKKIIAVLLGIILVFSFTGCGGEKSQYEKDLENGQRKSYSGEPKTKGEQKALDDFNNWKSEENAKKYSK